MKRSAGLVVAAIMGFLAIDWVASVRGQVGLPAVPPPPAGVVVEAKPYPPSATVRRLPGDPADRESSGLRGQDYELGRQADSLAGQYGAAKDDAAKEKLRSQLRDVLNKQFEVHHKRREQELEKLEARVRSLREILNKRNEQRQTIVDRRLEQLVRDAEGLGWSGPGAGVPSTGSSAGFRILGERTELPEMVLPGPAGAPGKQPAARP
jgi:hypothetical protein